MDEAVRQFRTVVAELENLGRSPLPQQYLAWVDTCESRLRGVFIEPDVAARLHTDRYWHIYADHYDYSVQDPNLPMPDVCGQEAMMQLAALQELAAQCDQMCALVQRPGRVVVYDTNSLMHFQPPDKIDWVRLIRDDKVRLVVPLVVIDELDRKKYAGSPKMAERAAAALRALDAALDGAPPGAAVGLPGRAGVSIEVLLDEPGHTRMAAADDEIIERSVLLTQLSGGPVTVVTADIGMRLRVQAAGLSALKLADRYGKDQSPR